MSVNTSNQILINNVNQSINNINIHINIINIIYTPPKLVDTILFFMEFYAPKVKKTICLVLKLNILPHVINL